METNLQQKVHRYDFDGGESLCRNAVCLGDWVMLEALQHMEAGQLHALGGRPKQLRMGDHPWKISLSQAQLVQESSPQKVETVQEISEENLHKLKDLLSLRYAHTQATQAPSKQTATGRKGREKDEEAAENTQEPRYTERIWRRPSFVQQHSGGVAYGNVVHRVMQYIRYHSCGSDAEVMAEIQRLTDQGFIKKEEANLINTQEITSFFQSDIGRKLRGGIPFLREFKFSILDDGNHYGEGLEGEAVLLQGVVDCALLEDDGITVVDFKTDMVTDETLGAAVERYRPQVQTYAEALSRIYEMPVKEKNLYFFRLNRFVKL